MGGEINKGIIIHGGAIHADAIGVGDYATVTSNASQQLASEIDMPKLADELQQLRKALRQEATEVAHDEVLVALGQAEQAARNGNGKVVLDCLKKAGMWALDVGTKIGVTLATDAIKAAING